MSDILRKQNRMMNIPALTAEQIPYGSSNVKDALDGLTANTFGESVSLTANTPITAISDGYVVYSCGASSGNYCYLYINDVNVGNVVFASNLAGLPKACIFVKKGMTIKFEGVNAQATFYPLTDIVKLIPLMTSDTTPSGQVIYNSVYTQSGSYAGWKAFDGNDSTGWAAASNTTGNYIGYVFVNPVLVTNAILYNKNEGSPCTCVIQASDDGTTWINISNPFTFSASTSNTTVELTPSKAYRYYRLTNTTGNSTLNVFRFELYGKPSA